MCVYCMTGDWPFRNDPPWKVPEQHPSYPFLPQPIVPMPAMEWPLAKLKEYYELLLKVKALEDQLGCPCDPNKADYVTLFKDRIAELERRLPGKNVEAP